MSRIIKCRAWDTVERRYLHSEKQEFICTTHSDGFGVTIPYPNKNNHGNFDEGCFDWADADLLAGRYQLEQYTGLKDRNGREIYEGDIVKMPDWQVKPKFEIVKFTQLACGFEPFVNGCRECWAPDGEETEVIGNIHENPELLETENDWQKN